MDNRYRIHSSVSCSNTDNVIHVGNYSSVRSTTTINELIGFQSSGLRSETASSDMMKAQIRNHPLFPDLLSGSEECHKVGTQQGKLSLLDEVNTNNVPGGGSISALGVDPELDDFMDDYCEILRKFKEDLLKPCQEASTFIREMESQLEYICTENGTTTLASASYHVIDEAATSEKDLTCGEMEEGETLESSSVCQGDKELKEMLLRKYSGYLGTLRKDFLRKRKKGKLPKDARNELLKWWNAHYRWPYPTEEEKMKLSEVTGLGQKQINNWFINQRKRHWKPSEDMRVALLESVSRSKQGQSGGNSSGATTTFEF